MVKEALWQLMKSTDSPTSDIWHTQWISGRALVLHNGLEKWSGSQMLSMRFLHSLYLRKQRTNICIFSTQSSRWRVLIPPGIYRTVICQCILGRKEGTRFLSETGSPKISSFSSNQSPLKIPILISQAVLHRWLDLLYRTMLFQEKLTRKTSNGGFDTNSSRACQSNPIHSLALPLLESPGKGLFFKGIPALARGVAKPACAKKMWLISFVGTASWMCATWCMCCVGESCLHASMVQLCSLCGWW